MADALWDILSHKLCELENKFEIFLGLFTILALVVTYFFFFSKYAKYECWIFFEDGIPDDRRFYMDWNTVIFRVGRYYLIFIKKTNLAFINETIYREYKGYKYVRLFRGWKRQVFIMDLQMAMKVLGADCEYFKDRATVYYDRNKDPLKELTLLSPAFLISRTAGNIKEIHPLILYYAKKLENLEETSLLGASAEHHNLLNEYVIDVILTTLLGFPLFTKYNLKYLERTRDPRDPPISHHKIFQFAIFQHIEAIRGLIFNFDYDRTLLTSIKHFNDLSNASTSDGQVNNYEANEVYVRLLATLNMRKKDYRERLALDIGSQAFTLITIVSEWEGALGLCLCELATHPEIQDRLHQALDQIPDLSYQNLMACEYLDMVVKESLRKYPTIRFLQRECVKNYQFPHDEFGRLGIKIRKGTQVFISVSGMHNDPVLFREPDRFDPGRFSMERLSNIKPFTYMPFGTASLGGNDSQLTMAVIKTGLATLLRKYSFCPDYFTSEQMDEQSGIILVGFTWLSFKQRARNVTD